MTRLVLPLLTVAALAGAALAHPLGNFTTNRHATLTIAPGTVDVAYAIDFAEIPSFRELRALDADGDGTTTAAERDAYLAATSAAVAPNLHLAVDGGEVTWNPRQASVEIGSGAGGLPTVRVDLGFRAAVASSAATLTYRDDNFDGRPGWREVVARAGDGVALRASDVSTLDSSRQLRAYPTDLLATPPQVHTARVTFAPGAGGAVAGAPAVATSDGRLRDRLTDMVTDRQPLGPSMLLTSLLIAMGLGALHALSPGHGKSVVGAYLVGSRGTWKHAVLLGGVVTATHTLGVYALGFATLLASRWIVPERLMPWLSVVSGLVVLGIGASLVVSRLAIALADDGHGHDHDHHDGHDHGHHHHGHHHHPLPPAADGGVTWRQLMALGVSGGLLPCPSALVVMLGAIALGRVGFGLLLIVAFSIGLAAVLTSIGLAMVYARRFVERLPLDGRFARLVPVASAVVISVAGLLIVVQALGQMGV